MKFLKNGFVSLALSVATIAIMNLCSQKVVLAENPSNCELTTGREYQHTHNMNPGSFLGGMILSDRKVATTNNRQVTMFRGRWWVGSSDSDPLSRSGTILIQISGSSFMLTRYMDQDMIQFWFGTCYDSDYIRGRVVDPANGTGNFTIRTDDVW